MLDNYNNCSTTCTYKLYKRETKPAEPYTISKLYNVMYV